MNSLNSSLAIYLIVITLALTLVHVSQAQNSHQDYLDAHNAARAEVVVKPLKWNNTLEAFSRNTSIRRFSTCNAAQVPFEIGENVGEATFPLTGVEAVKLWANEKSYYDYDKNECVGRNCWHYIQVVSNLTMRCSYIIKTFIAKKEMYFRVVSTLRIK
ncbi:pathogenesis-related protein 1A-like [Hevea brasiliensis]|uniref:pathogenesis-related protein 1A-like n=1 Tax=Hevea brasiliensis TaxID=3981 RepID=UPI0025FAE182|nr:pathogenesis-related protein 1A-like [Hevea brasiliensis]